MEYDHGSSLLAMLDNMIEKKAEEVHAGQALADAYKELVELRRQRDYYAVKYGRLEH